MMDGVAAAAIEVKLLSDLGPKQLQRYVAAFPAARVHRVLHLEGLPVNLQRMKPWESLTWESVLRAHADSTNAWAADDGTRLAAPSPITGPGR